MTKLPMTPQDVLDVLNSARSMLSGVIEVLDAVDYSKENPKIKRYEYLITLYFGTEPAEINSFRKDELDEAIEKVEDYCKWVAET